MLHKYDLVIHSLAMSVEHVEQRLTAAVSRITEAPHQDATDKVKALPISMLKTYLGDLLTTLTGVQAETGPAALNAVMELDRKSESAAKDIDQLAGDIDARNPDLIATSRAATETAERYHGVTYGVASIINAADTMVSQIQALLEDVDNMAFLQDRASASIDKAVQSTAVTEASAAAYLHTVTGK